MSKRNSQIVKGIAVLLMLFYQLFANEEVYEQFSLTGLIMSETITAKVAMACEVCISLFVFVTAYGISVQSKNKLFDKKEYTGSFVRRYKKLICNFTYVFAIILLCTYVFRFEYTTQIAFERASKIGRGFSILGNITGTADLFNMSWFSPTWRYISLVIILFALVPLLQLLVKKAGAILTLVLSTIAVFVLSACTNGDIFGYLLIAVIGIIFAEYNLFEEIEACIKNKKGMRFFSTVFMIIAALFVVISRSYFDATYLVDIILAVLIVLLVNFFISYIPGINTVLSVIGKCSMYIWLVAAFFTTHWFQEYTYSFKNIWIIYLFIIVATFVVALVFMLVKKFYKMQITQKLYEKRWKMIVLSLIMLALCYVISFMSTIPTYMTCDDWDIQTLLNGSVTGSPYITHQFINIILGVIISSLYKLIPQLEWWYVYNLFAIGVGIFLIHISVLKVCKNKKINPSFAVFLMAVVDLSFIIYNISNVSYTVAPAILGTGIIAFIFATSNMSGKKNNRMIFLVTLIGYIFVQGERGYTGYVILCFILLTFLWRYLNLYGKGRMNWAVIKRFLLTSVFFILIAFGMFEFNGYCKLKINGSDFVEFNEARIEYIDYGHGTYADNREIYEEVGWSNELYSLVDESFFMDNSVNAESLSYLAENVKSNDSIVKSVISILKNIKSDRGICAITLVWLCSIFIAIIVLSTNFDKKHMLFIIMNNMGAVILLLYQLIMGRIFYRTILIVLLPAFVVNCFIAINNYCQGRRKTALIKLFLLLLTVFCSIFVLNYTFDIKKHAYKEYLIGKCTAIERLVTANRDNIYIYAPSLYNSVGPVSVFTSGNDLTNMIPWGGTSYGSAGYLERLEINGLDGILGEALKEDNVYFLTNLNLLDEDYEYKAFNQICKFYTYLEAGFDAKGFVVTDATDDGWAYAYHFIFEENMDDYSVYYTIEDGQIVEIINESE